MTRGVRMYTECGLYEFILRAKNNTYAGDGERCISTRKSSVDMEYIEGNLCYHDTYFANVDFSGQEAVYYKDRPVWTMVYYGKVTRPDMVSASEIGAMIKESLSMMYIEGRFLGGFSYQKDNFCYIDRNEGEFSYFHGTEVIFKDGIPVYELKYTGGTLD